MNCDCLDWKENIDKVNAPLMLAAARSGFRVQYDGVRFRFCPWCANPLKESEADSVSNGNEKSPTPPVTKNQSLADILNTVEKIEFPTVEMQSRLVKAVRVTFAAVSRLRECSKLEAQLSSILTSPENGEEQSKNIWGKADVDHSQGASEIVGEPGAVIPAVPTGQKE